MTGLFLPSTVGALTAATASPLPPPLPLRHNPNTKHGQSDDTAITPLPSSPMLVAADTVTPATVPPSSPLPSLPVIEQGLLRCHRPLFLPSLPLPPHRCRCLCPCAADQIPRKPATAITRYRCCRRWLLPPPYHLRRCCLAAATIAVTISAQSPSKSCSSLAALYLRHRCRCHPTAALVSLPPPSKQAKPFQRHTIALMLLLPLLVDAVGCCCHRPTVDAMALLSPPSLSPSLPGTTLGPLRLRSS